MDCPIRHLGTEKAQTLYYDIEQYLLQNGVEILFGYECTDILIGKREMHRRSNYKRERIARDFV